MAALINALDNFTPSQLGEKGHNEYTWSNNIYEKILQLSFQLTRTNSEKINELAMQTNIILKQLIHHYENAIITKDIYIEYMSIMYKMIGQTRDIISGKGEYTLSYMLLNVWFNYFPELAKFAYKHFFIPLENTENTHPYGSWKDFKYMYNYKPECELNNYGIQLVNEQVRKDMNSDNPSLVAKWIPREKSKFSDLFTLLALDYFSEYIKTAKDRDSLKRSINKAKMDYRKIISKLNKRLQTVQINQCGKNWANIDPSMQTSITMHKQKKAFLNITKNGDVRYHDEDRHICAKKFEEFIMNLSNGLNKVKGQRIGLNDFTKNALEIISYNKTDSVEAKLLNEQWIDNSKQTLSLSKMIAMVDVSGSMEGDPLNAAIALGIRVAEKSILGKRVLTFSSEPNWVNLENSDNFINMVSTIKTANWGMNTNFEKALNMILDAIICQKLTPEDTEDMVLAIFSDMQIDAAMDMKQGKNMNSMINMIEEKYSAAGIRLWGKPFKAPHILFWNLRSTSGFPALSNQTNVSMMSGFSPVLLNLFCENGLSALQGSAWRMFIHSLSNERYKILDSKIREML
jgi:hypothetical protein